jgi:ABC-2 type transport system ATP-binding protein
VTARGARKRIVRGDASPVELDADKPGLELIDLHHRWRRDRQPVVAGVSLWLAPGTATWIGGQNGVGKTTLLRIAAGILLPQAGIVRLDGLDPIRHRGAYQRQLGFLSAGDRGLSARMTVDQQLDYWARLAYVPRTVRPACVADAIAAFELEALAKQRVDRISMGQRQRVRLAMALLHAPKVVLLDEPHNSLDDDGNRVLAAQVTAAVRRGAAVLWCSPRGDDQMLASHVSYTLEDGQLERTA